MDSDLYRQALSARRSAIWGVVIWGTISSVALLASIASVVSAQSGGQGGFVFFGAVIFGGYRCIRHAGRLLDVENFRRVLLATAQD